MHNESQADRAETIVKPSKMDRIKGAVATIGVIAIPVALTAVPVIVTIKTGKMNLETARLNLEAARLNAKL